jgi:aryl-alcohol dehydrogenase-like predicted oxidoreductase
VRDTLEELVTKGKIRAYGWSTDFPKSAEFFASGEHCATIQAELNVLDDNAAILAICEKENLAVINRGPLAMGLLTGKYVGDVKPSADDVRGQKSPEWMKYFKDGKASADYMKKVDAIREILTSNGRSISQGAIAWLWARSPKTVPIPGFRTVKQVEENCKAMEFGPLTSDQMAEIGRILGR